LVPLGSQSSDRGRRSNIARFPQRLKAASKSGGFGTTKVVL
jgi:hypothetical protein